MPAPYYQPPTEYGLTHPDPHAAITAAKDAREQDRVGTANSILNGVASRSDLTDDHVARLVRIAEDGPNRALGSGLVTNPSLRDRPEVRALIGPPMVATLIAHPDVHLYIDDILGNLVSDQRAHFKTEDAYVAAVKAALPLDAVNAYFVRAINTGDPAQITHSATHPLLSDDGFALLIEIIETTRATPAGRAAASDDLDFAQTIYEHLCHRKNLTTEQALTLHRLGLALARTVRRDRWVLMPLLWNQHAPVEVSMALVNHPARSIREMVLTQNHVRVETIVAALRCHIPYAVLRLQHATSTHGLLDYRLPDDAVKVLLDDLEAGTARTKTLPVTQRLDCLKAALIWAPGPVAWDRALSIYLTLGAAAHTSEDTDPHEAARAFFKAATEPARFRVGRQQTAALRDEFLIWATVCPNEAVRAEAVQALALPEHLIAASHDESALVRRATIAHPATPPDAVAALAHDPDPTVRAAVVAHPTMGWQFMTVLAGDPAREVRDAVADRFLTALA